MTPPQWGQSSIPKNILSLEGECHRPPPHRRTVEETRKGMDAGSEPDSGLSSALTNCRPSEERLSPSAPSVLIYL